MTQDSPPWLRELQSSFSSALRTPLTRHTGQLEANMASYAPELLSQLQPGAALTAAEQLAVYNRQYWFRLFTVLHKAFPLSSRIVGLWELNGIASQYLQRCPPVDAELERIADGFPTFVEGILSETKLPGLREQAFRQALSIDASWRAVFGASPVAPFVPAGADVGRLPACRLVRSPAFAIVEQSFPLLDLRARALTESAEGAFELPAPWGSVEHWALLRAPQGMMQHRLEPLEARLHQLVTTQALAEALVTLEGEVTDAERADLPLRTQQWLAKAMRVGAFAGIEPA